MSPTRTAAPRALRRLAVTLLIAGALIGLPAAATAVPAGPRIDVLELNGVIDRPLAEFARGVLREAGTTGSDLVVINLNSRGALGGAATDLAAAIDASPVPVAVWVGPSGARATGGGYVVAAAAHVVGVSHGVVVGAAAPADLGAPDADAQPLADLLEGYAAARGRDPRFAVDAARQGAAAAVLPAGERLGPQASLPPGVDGRGLRVLEGQEVADVAEVTASTLPGFLRELDLRPVTVEGAATTLDIDPTSATVRYHNPGLWRRLLHAVTDPTLAYLLLIGGALALLFEFFQPGFGVAGFSGLPVLALGLYGLWVLPASWAGVALIAAGLVLLAVDLARGGLGTVTAAGTTGLTAGSLLLFRGPPPMSLSGWLVASVVASCVLFWVVVMTTVLRAQRQQLPAPPEELRGRVGVVRSMLNPEGHVFVDGALWRARAPDDAGKVRTGTRVRIADVAPDATLRVELVVEEEASTTG